MVACDLQERFIFGLEESGHFPLFPDWAFNRIRRVAKNDLIVFEKFEKTPDCCQFAFSGLAAGLLRRKGVDIFDDIDALQAIRDIPITPPLLQPSEKVLQIA